MKMSFYRYFVLILFLLGALDDVHASVRRTYNLMHCRAVCYPEDTVRYGDSIVAGYVSLPHNFDDYYGARRLPHGELHGTVVYDFEFPLFPSNHPEDLLYRLRIEGAGTYVSVIVNGQAVCSRRPVGFVSTAIDLNADNLYLESNHLRIICHHPSGDKDMPWRCDGCQSDSGEEGLPMGLFRPVVLEECHTLHFQPFGVHAWSNEACDTLFVDTEVCNMNPNLGAPRLRTSLVVQLPLAEDSSQMIQYNVADDLIKFRAPYGKTTTVHQAIPLAERVRRWSPEQPVVYQIQSTLHGFDYEVYSTVYHDRQITDFGFRKQSWSPQLCLEDVCIPWEGVSDAERAFGHHCALPNQEIDHRCLQVYAMGRKVYREVGHPQNVRFKRNWNILGVPYISQFSAGGWQDTPAFRTRYKEMLRQWVKERRNDPSLVLWDICHDPTMPEDFAAECAAIIREMDPMWRTRLMPAERLDSLLQPFQLFLYADTPQALYSTWGQPSVVASSQMPDSLLSAEVGPMASLLLKGTPAMTYLYRYNCGGGRLQDSWGQEWLADDTLHTKTYAQRESLLRDGLGLLPDAKGMTECAVGVAFDGEHIQRLPDADQMLMRTFRWGRQDMKFSFAVDSCQLYCIDLFLLEPWSDVPYARVYDIAVNGDLVDQERDVAAVSGGKNRLIRTTIRYYCKDQEHLEISFPHIASGQVVINAIAISRLSDAPE